METFSPKWDLKPGFPALNVRILYLHCQIDRDIQVRTSFLIAGWQLLHPREIQQKNIKLEFTH